MTTDRIVRLQHDLAKEARRRLLIGLSGLSVMLLLVMLVSWLTTEARQEAGLARAQAEAAGVPKDQVGGTGKANDSMADMGVAPQLPVTPKENASAGPASPAPQVTPAAPQP